MGRKSIFLINGMIFVSSFGLMMIYFIVFGDISASIAAENLKNPDSFVCKRAFYVIIIATFILPLILKKEISELKIAAVLLFVSISLFIMIFVF